MNEIKGNVTITLTAEEVHDFNTLVRRDYPKPMGKYFWKGEYAHKEPSNTCGVCDRVLSDEYVFCPYCGQRIDREHYAL